MVWTNGTLGDIYLDAFFFYHFDCCPDFLRSHSHAWVCSNSWLIKGQTHSCPLLATLFSRQTSHHPTTTNITTHIMEDPNAQQQGAAFPAPPYYFQRYTQPNLALLEKIKSDPTNPDLTTALDELPFPILALEPPPPIKRGICWMFGRPWPVCLSRAQRWQDCVLDGFCFRLV